MEYMKVEQFLNKNQFRLYDNNVEMLQSYDSLVVRIENNIITLGRDWDYSTTTSKHVYAFIKEYAWNVKDDEGHNIGYKLTRETNKRKYINKLIEKGIIEYNNEMV